MNKNACSGLSLRQSRGLILATVLCLILSLVPLPIGSAALAGVVATYTLDLSSNGGGSVSASPAGPTYEAGTVVTLTANPGSNILVEWTLDGATQGWVNPLTITMGADHTVVATFAPATTFGDVPSNDPAATAIAQLATRGYIQGYNDQEYGPGDEMQRAQMAALIARATPGDSPAGHTIAPPACLVAETWDCEEWGNDFTDRAGLEGNLWRNVGTLQHYEVALGYTAQDCAAKEKNFPCYGPTDPVTYAETIAFITRAMVAKGYWTPTGAPYPGAPADFAAEFATYVYYTGSVPTPPANWHDHANRGWFARALWQATDSYFGGTGSADSYTTAEDTALNVAAPGVLGNDRNLAGGALTAVQVAGPAHGSLTLNANGSFTYTPEAQYNGPDNFTYQSRDANGVISAVTTVGLTVTAVNDAPVNGVPGPQNASANTPLTFSTANSNAITVADLDAGTNPVQVTLTATNGTLTLNGTAGLTFVIGTGTADVTTVFTGTLSAINAALDGLAFAPAANFVGSATIQVATNDQGNTGTGGPLTTNAAVTVAVTAGAAASIAKVAGDGGSTTVGTERTLQVKVTDGTGAPVQGYTVNWAVATGGGTVSAPTSSTNADGIASVDWTLGTTTGTQSATATALGLADSPLTFSTVSTPGPLDDFTVEAATGGTIPMQTAGVSFAITITAEDAYGNTVTEFNGGANTADLTTTPAGGLSAGGGTTPPFVNGMLTWHSVTFGSGGDYSITATRTGGAEFGTSNAFTVQVLPTVTSLSLTSGPTAGGTVVTITGTGFTGATAVTFGGTPATSFTVNSDTQIVATTPAHAAGTVDVIVTTPAGSSAIGTASEYTYVAPPAVTSVSPDGGPTAGGTVVTIAGTGFTGATAVEFDGVAATSFTVNSDTQITAVTPAHAEETIYVRVTTAGGISPTDISAWYTYAAPPVITSLSPTAGPLVGGTSVTIFGSGFTSATAVAFDGISASFTVISPSTIVATAPAHIAAIVDVTVTSPGGTSATGPATKYTYTPPPGINIGPVLAFAPGTDVTASMTTVAGGGPIWREDSLLELG